MSKILLALSILSASAAGFLAVRQSTVDFQRAANAARESWQLETQRVAVAQSQQFSLKAHQENLRRSLRERLVVVVNPVWSALQTNVTGELPVELRENLLRELGFDWHSSPDFIVITKQALRETGPRWIIQNGECTDMAASVFTMTPGERAQVEAALKRAQAEYKAWAREQVKRMEQAGTTSQAEEVWYTVPANPSIRTNLAVAVSQALGTNRESFFSTQGYMNIDHVNFSEVRMAITRHQAGNETRVEVFFSRPPGFRDLWDNVRGDLVPFPEAFLPVFTNGWADVAEREGFELPKGPPKE